MTRTVGFTCPYCRRSYAFMTAVDRKYVCPACSKPVYFDARYRSIDPDEPAVELNALLDDVIAEARARREFIVTLASFLFGIILGVFMTSVAVVFGLIG